MKNAWRFAVFIGLLRFSTAQAIDATGLNVSAAVDTVAHQGLGASAVGDRIDVREAEFLLNASVDHLFDGMVSFAAHYEGGGIPLTELHEAYISSTKLIPRSRFRLGQFFLGVGRLNQFHRHDWPFITAPKVHSLFFANEAANDTGVEYSYLLPVPHFVELTAGLTNGWVFGHSHVSGSKALLPTHYLRAVTSVPVPWEGASQLGLNYLGRRASDGMTMTMLGADYTAKWREAQVLKFLLQTEVWYRAQTPRGRTTDKALGLYVYPQYYVGWDVFVGMRFDYFANLNVRDAFGTDIKSFEMSVVPTVAWKPSEFSTVRLAYTHTAEYYDTSYRTPQRMFELQAIFFLGAHPAHEF